MRPKSYSAVAWGTNSVSNIYKSLAGKWTGYASPTSGSNVALEVDVKPDGSYTTKWGSTMGKGVIRKDGDTLTAEGDLITGTGTAAAGVGKSELTVTSKDGLFWAAPIVGAVLAGWLSRVASRGKNLPPLMGA
jgi:hypothetical protein